MTSARWLKCADPKAMLDLLGPRATDRKLRLFGCACSRLVADLLPETSFHTAIDVAERYADGQASEKERWAANKESGAAMERIEKSGSAIPVNRAMGCAWSCTRGAGTAARYPLWVLTDEADLAREVQLLRDIIGNPFRPVAFDPCWRTADVTALARGIYEDRAFDRLPLLADALMDAGWDHDDILAHCQSEGPHVRGCWVVDLVLGKE
jgi:hypothetical protein